MCKKKERRKNEWRNVKKRERGRKRNEWRNVKKVGKGREMT